MCSNDVRDGGGDVGNDNLCGRSSICVCRYIPLQIARGHTHVANTVILCIYSYDGHMAAAHVRWRYPRDRERTSVRFPNGLSTLICNCNVLLLYYCCCTCTLYIIILFVYILFVYDIVGYL